MDTSFNNENKAWEYSLDIDDFDLHLTHVVRSSNSTHVKPSPYTTNPVTIIPGPLGVVHVSSSTRVEPSTSNLNPVRIILSPADKVVEDVSDDDDFKSAASVSATNYVNTFGGTVTGCLGDKVIGKGGYGKDITVGAAMILKNVSVCSPNPSKHYLNITMRNVVEVFRKDTVLVNDSG
nr:hypothetical protein [Tanacetum cinerariifolium]